MSKLSEVIKKHNIEIIAIHLFLDDSDLKWIHDVWRTTIKYNGRSYTPELPYKTGIGHREKSKLVYGPITKERGGYYSQHHGLWLSEREAMIKWFKPQVIAADILHTYLTDTLSVDESFDNWCSEFGYNNDSIKALKTYTDCQKTRDNLIKLFGTLLFEKLLVASRDY